VALVDVSEIVLLIARPVQSEIDRMKNDGNTRRSKKARKANSLFLRILENEYNELKTKVKDKQVVIRFAPNYKLDDLAKAVSHLDVMNRNDDELVATAVMYKSQNPNSDVRILTQDTGVILSAKQYQLAYILIPDEWKLPPEKDERDKKIEALEKKVRILSEQFPIIELTKKTTLKGEVGILTELTDDVVDRLLSVIQNRFPLKQKFSQVGSPSLVLRNSGLYRFVPPTKEEIDDYRYKYDEWLEECRCWLNDVYTIMAQRESVLTLQFTLSNNGATSAERLLIEITACGKIELAVMSQNDSEAGIPKAPLPPKPPVGKWVSPFASNPLPDLKSLLNDSSMRMYYPHVTVPSVFERSDPYCLYWDEEGSNSFNTKLTGRCEEFRHGRSPVQFCISVRSSVPETTVRGSLSVLVTGKNMPETYRRNIPVNILPLEKDAYAVLLTIVQNSFSLV
jgi:hypothetical protein